MEKHIMAMVAGMALVCSLSLSACGGGGGGDSPAPVPAVQSAPQPKSVLIEVYGDSTALGCTVIPGASPGACQVAGYAQANPTAPQELQTLLQAKYGSTVTVVNHGVAGTTAARLLTGDGVNLPWAQQMAQSKADVVTFNFGINDSKMAADEPASTFQSNEAELIQIAKAAGKTVVLETANPVTDPACAALPTYVAASIAAGNLWGIPIVDQYGALSVNPQWTSMLSDLEHPTAAGYMLKAQQAFQVLDPIVAFALSH